MPSISERLAAAKAAMSDPGTMIGTFNQIADDLHQIASAVAPLPQLAQYLAGAPATAVQETSDRGQLILFSPDATFNNDRDVQASGDIQGFIAWVPGTPLGVAVNLVLDGIPTPAFSCLLVLPWRQPGRVTLSAQPTSPVYVRFVDYVPAPARI